MEKVVILAGGLSPEEIETLEEKCRNTDYISSAYNVAPYSISGYLREKHVREGEVHALLDRNIVSSLTAAAQRGKIEGKDEQSAIELLAFLRAAEIEIEPGISLVEYGDSHSCPNPDEELTLLRRMDNIPNDNLLQLAMGQDTIIKLAGSSYTEKRSLQKRVLRADDIHQWNIFYGYALKLYLLTHSEADRFERSRVLIYWIWKDFLFSGIGLSFAGTFFSERFSRMIKGINSKNPTKLLKGLRNAAWDMTIVSYWCDKVVHRKERNGPLMIFCTADKGIRAASRNVLGDSSSNLSEHFSRIFGCYLKPKQTEKLLEFYLELNSRSEDPSRRVHGYKRDQGYFDDYILELESEVKTKINANAQQTH